jgi:lysyl-tRNA synthetase class 2
MSSREEQIIQARKDKLAKLIGLGVNVNPPQYNPTHKTSDCIIVDLKVNIAGRILGYRRQGKVAFVDLTDDVGRVQVFASLADLSETYEIVKLLDIGDFIGVSGTTFKTSAGALTVKVEGLTFLGKSMSPLPDIWSGLRDKEDRYRRRYLDLILNKDAKSLLDKRWAIEKAVREFMWSEKYQEVETPILQNLYGGTNAKPFTTHLNALDAEMYLRVAPELYLKRLIVGGYERVFEIARNFRNEGMDQTHQPEFTMMEFYEAYADYHRMMDITEELIKSVAQKVNGSLELKMEEHDINLSGKWRRITIDEALSEYAGLDWENITDEEIKSVMADNKIKVMGVFSRAKALFAIYDHLVTPQLIQPTWVIDYPVEVSPLSKTHRSKKGRVERFEGYVGGKEIFDGWSEIVSEHEQRERFDNEQKNMKAGDDEAQPLDEEFLEALSYGCPPLGGIGIGIDRLVMFLSNTWSIREVIAFPLMRREGGSPMIAPKKEIKASDKKIVSGKIDESVQALFPGMFYAYTVIDGVDIKKSNPSLKKLTKEVIAGNTHELEAIGELKPIKAYREIFKKTGAWKLSRRPSPEALLRRLATGKGIYNINTAVDAYNLAVIETGVGLGGFNADKIAFPVTLRTTRQGEQMHLLGDDEPTTVMDGEMAYADSEKLITLDLNYRDIDATKITEDTSRIILYADGAQGLSEEEVVSALQKGAGYIKQFCGGTVSEITVVK